MMEYQKGVVAFFDNAIEDCIVRESIDAEMLSGLIVGRIADQVEDAEWIKKVTGENIIENEEYRERWLKANIDILLNGALA